MTLGSQFLISISILTFVSKNEAVIDFFPHVKISDGMLVGESGKSLSGRDFHKFWCVPYGQAERFEPSVPSDPWEGVRDATGCSVRCPQTDMTGGLGDLNPFSGGDTEDCLVLNVFVPHMDSILHPTLPVMFWIHGGYFVMGSSMEYSGEIFLDENVILVSINYRLGAFGFLTPGDGVIEGNLGLKDMVLALEWVQKNIHHFGGDAQKVTIFGESAGATAVNYLVLSPITKGLFINAMSQSGGATVAWSYQSRPLETFLQFVVELNCTRRTTTESVACLKKIPMDDLALNQEIKFLAEMKYPAFPIVEVVPPKKSRNFLPEHPRKMVMEGNFNRVPYIQGVVADEASLLTCVLFNSDYNVEQVNRNWIKNGAIIMGLDHRNISIPNINLGLRKTRRFYFGDEEISEKQAQNFCDLVTDAYFLQAMYSNIKYYPKYAPYYVYLFTKQGGMNLGHASNKLFNKSMSTHGDDVTYQFYKGVANSPSEFDFTKNFIKLWVSFAYTGKPSHTWGSAKVWPPVDKNADVADCPFYNLNDDTAILKNPYIDRMIFWNGLIENEWEELPEIECKKLVGDLHSN